MRLSYGVSITVSLETLYTEKRRRGPIRITR